MRIKHTKNAPKSHAMTAEAMQILVAGMGFNLSELSAVLAIPYRTLQDYYYGTRAIPAPVAEKLREEARREIEIRNQVYQGIELDIAKSYPQGLKCE